MRNTIRTSVMLVTILVLPLLVLVARETSAFLIEGQQGQARVIQVQGKNYVEVEGLARITGGSLRFAGNTNHSDIAQRQQYSTTDGAVRIRARTRGGEARIALSRIGNWSHPDSYSECGRDPLQDGLRWNLAAKMPVAVR